MSTAQLPCLANPIDQPSVNERSTASNYDEKPKICAELEARINNVTEWNTQELDQAVCHVVGRGDKARKDWEVRVSAIMCSHWFSRQIKEHASH